MLKVSDLMTQNPDTVAPNTPVRKIIAKMNQEGYRQIPVLDAGKLLGIVTDRDIRLAMDSPVLEEGHLAHQARHHPERSTTADYLTAKNCMTAQLKTVKPDTPAHEAADLLCVHKFGALPVVENETLVGIVTVTDFLKYLSSRFKNDL